MHVDTARSVLAAAGRHRGRPAEPWTPGGEIQRAPRAVSPFDRVVALVRRWLS
ncbi:hypothetical protein ACM64Y_20080 [Novispirillum sp. DQ9]|uniref:hypothetical protein n=1 Tax=Novispirillum sp. DQ9 TaxID=3398612 RepID=UPI003C7C8C59